MLLQMRSKRKSNVQEFHLQLQPENLKSQSEALWRQHRRLPQDSQQEATIWLRCHAKKQPHTFLSQIGLNGHVCFTCQSLWKLVTHLLDLCCVHDCALCQKFFSFTHKGVYSQKLLHTDAVTQSSLYTESFNTQARLHTETFTQRNLYRERVFTNGSF